MHRNREWYKNHITILLHRTESYTQVWQDGSKAAYFITQRNTYVVTQAHRRRLGRKGNLIYTFQRRNRNLLLPLKNIREGWVRTVLSKSYLKSRLFKCMGYKSRLGLGFSFVKTLDFKCKWWDPLGCLLKKEWKTRVRAFGSYRR